MGKHEVTIVTDWTVPMASVHMSLHVPPPPKPDSSYPHLEAPAMIGQFFGVPVHKFTKNVVHKNWPIAKDGHDCGFGIPHLTYPPNSVYLIVHTLMSKRKTMFGASTVRMNGYATGVIDLTGFAPMLMCADPISLPLEWAPTNCTNTVYIGTTARDIIGGWLAIAVTLVIEAIIFRVAKAGGHHWEKAGKAVEYSVKLGIKTALKLVLLGLGFLGISPGHNAKRLLEPILEPGTPGSHATTSSPFGNSTIALSQNSDGSFHARTSSPTATGGQHNQEFGGLGIFGSAAEDRSAHPAGFESLFAHAPAV